ncbi:MAG TPA: hypothetical protein ENJ41_08860 [Oceanospirillales bacterium]|nr:hypothetical protein [Oceanospirillales bacterium]
MKYLFLFITSIHILSCSSNQDSEYQQKIIEYTGQLVANKEKQPINDFPLLKQYISQVEQSLLQNPPVLLIDQSILPDSNYHAAQKLALKNRRFTQYSHHQDGTPLRNEIMNVRRLLAADISSINKDNLKQCKQQCYRIEMYNYFYNMSSVAFVDVDQQRVLSINNYSDAQPDINKKLTQLAIAIAKNSALVKKELKLQEDNIEPTMAQIKTSLKNSRCERSHHLCVAPTFVVGDRALWAIVDLTEGNLVGTRWTDLGDSGPPIEVTERQLENEFVFSEFCEKSRHFQQGAWQFDYQITSSDGMEITQVKYNDQTVMNSAKLLDWHVSYSSREGFGYSDAIGCPLFSSAVVIAYEGPQIENIKQNGKNVGFAFIQDFRQPPWPTPCNYRYEQRFEFYHDGRFRVAAADYGRGCGTDGTYRPVIRMDIEAGSTDGAEQFAQWDGSDWQQWQQEQWQLQTQQTQYTDEGYLFKFSNAKNNGFYIEPNRGQFNDGSKGDFAYSYITVKHDDKDEGKQDMITLGSCCNKDYQQGPEQFISPSEKLADENLVLWYVPQIKNNGNQGEEYCWADTRVEKGIKKIKVWPCYAGPMFVPIAADDKR